MANSNLLADLENYRKFALTTHVFKNTSGAERFFAYAGPNGKKMASNEVLLVQRREMDWSGVLAKQALNRDLALGNVKYGSTGVTLYHFRFNAAGTAQTVAAIAPGRVVGVFAMTEAGATGDEAITATVAGTSIVTAAQTLVAASETTAKAKEVTLNATDANLNTVPGTISVSLTNMGAGDIATIVVAIAHHSS